MSTRIQWGAWFDDNSKIKEFENGKETIFTDILPRKNELKEFWLDDTQKNVIYALDLKKGTFHFADYEGNSVASFGISKEIDGRTIEFSNRDFDYAGGIIQYKCTKPMAIGEQAVPATFNMGYKIAIPQKYYQYEKYTKGLVSCIEVTHCQAILSVNADNLFPNLAITLTHRITHPNGKVEEVKL